MRRYLIQLSPINRSGAGLAASGSPGGAGKGGEMELILASAVTFKEAAQGL